MWLQIKDSAGVATGNYLRLSLDDLVDPDSGWTDLDAVAMSDNGFIAGKGNFNGELKTFLLVPGVDIVPDYDRDGVIDNTDRNRITDTNPFRWWFNNDNDIGEASGEDAPLASSPDWMSVAVDTSRDLVDFFPIFIDLKDFLSAFDDLSKITVKLKHEQGGLNCVYTDRFATR